MTEQIPMLPEWIKYWENVRPRLDTYIENSRNAVAQNYLELCLAFFSWMTEGLETKTKQNAEHREKIAVMIVETQDILRGIVACHRDQTLAPVVLLLRTAFEIHCNLKFIVLSPDAAKYADRYARFVEIEKLTGIKSLPTLPDPSPAEWQAASITHSEWFKVGTTKLKDKLHWTAELRTLREVTAVAHVDLENEYVSIYKTNSKFTHASPLIANLYRKQTSLRCVPSSSQCAQSAVIGAEFCLRTLELFIKFLGIPWPAMDKTVIDIEALLVQDLITGVAGADLEEARSRIIARISEQAKNMRSKRKC